MPFTTEPWKQQYKLWFRPTFVAAQVGRAPGTGAIDRVRVVCMGVLVGALVVRAERLAALLLLALVPVTLHVFGVVDQRVTV